MNLNKKQVDHLSLDFMSTFEYGAVARKDTILAQYAAASGNFDVMSADIFKRLSSKDVTFACEKDGHKFYIYHDEDSNLNFIISGTLSIQSQTAYTFLNQIRKLFFHKFNKNSWEQARPYGLQNEFSNVIKENMTNTRIAAIKDNLADTEQKMQESLQAALLRGEQLEDLHEAALSIELTSKEYSRGARQIRIKMYWDKYKPFIVIGCVVIFLIIILSIIVASASKKKHE